MAIRRDSAWAFVTRPWSVSIEGEVDKPQRVDLDQQSKIELLNSY